METLEKNNLSISSEKPRVEELIRQFKMDGFQGEYWGRLRDYEDTRFAYWDGQSDDGKKHSDNLPEGESAFPWEDANDSRVYLADELCNEYAAMASSAFWRADLRVVPVGVDDVMEASNATKFLNWLKKNKLASSLVDEVELSAQYVGTSGWCALDVSWIREIGYRRMPAKMENFVQIAEKLSQSGDEDLGDYFNALRVYADTVMLPEAEDTAIELTKVIYIEKIKMQYPDFADEIDEMTTKEARKVVRSLRETGEAVVKTPYLCRNEPCITARKAYRDAIIPYETSNLDGGIPIFIREYLTEDQVRFRELSEKWDSKWVELAIKTKGRQSTWDSTYDSSKNPSYQWQWSDRRSELIEVVHAYKRAVDDDGISSVWMTTFSPHITKESSDDDAPAARHIDLQYPCFPVVEVTREKVDRSIISSRGIPSLVITDQREQKVESDALSDSASIGTIPPVLVPRSSMGKPLKFGPAQQNTFKAGQKPEFMNVPTDGAKLSIAHIELVDSRVARRFGRFNESVPPALSQLIMEPIIRRFLSSWARAFKIAYLMSLKFAPEMIERVAGMRPRAADTLDMGDFDFIFKFDAANLNPDLMVQKLNAYSELMKEDKAGVILNDKLIVWKARLIDPEWADELVQDQPGASEAMFRQVQEDLVQMFNGNEVIYSDASNDPTAQAKANYAVQIIGKNPKFIQALDPKVLGEILPQAQEAQIESNPDPIFSAYVEKYFDNLKQGISQQENKTTGRTGVK